MIMLLTKALVPATFAGRPKGLPNFLKFNLVLPLLKVHDTLTECARLMCDKLNEAAKNNEEKDFRR